VGRDRKLKHALYMMTMLQVHRPSTGRAYYRRKLAEGKSPKEAAVFEAAAVGRRLPMPAGRPAPPAKPGRTGLSADCLPPASDHG